MKLSRWVLENTWVKLLVQYLGQFIETPHFLESYCEVYGCVDLATTEVSPNQHTWTEICILRICLLVEHMSTCSSLTKAWMARFKHTCRKHIEGAFWNINFRI